MKFTMKERGSIAGIDCKFFDNFNLIFLKNFNCILYSQDHRIKLWHQLISPIKFVATLKLNQSLRKFICRKLRVSLLNTVSLKEIKQTVLCSNTLKFQGHNKNNRSLNITCTESFTC